MNEITTTTPAKSGLQLGVLFGVLMVLEFIIGYSMDIDPATSPAFGWTINILNYFVFPIWLIFMGCNNFKKGNGGYATLGQCIKIGLVICLIAALIYCIFFVIFTAIFPEFIPEMMEKMKSVMIAQNPDMPQEQMDMALKITEKMFQPVWIFAASLGIFAFLGLIYGLIIGAIVKKDKPVSL